jgi:N-glycosylase/DNA lyase
LRNRLHSFERASALRRSLVTDLGLGPKQASLFLRNTGYGSELAVIDRHVWRYVTLLGWFDNGSPPANLNSYETVESLLQVRARNQGLSMSTFDRALWVVFRVLTSRADI